MPTRVGNAAAVLAAAWSLPHRCCQALLRASSSAVVSAAGGGGYSYRGYVGTASQRASKTTASLAGSFVPGGAGRRKVTTAAAAAAGRIGSSGCSGSGSGSSFVGGGPRGSAAAGGRDGTAMRMVSGGGSDESQFFTDPDAPLDVEGIGPPGPLVGGDQVRHEGCKQRSGRNSSPTALLQNENKVLIWARRWWCGARGTLCVRGCLSRLSAQILCEACGRHCCCTANSGSRHETCTRHTHLRCLAQALQSQVLALTAYTPDTCRRPL